MRTPIESDADVGAYRRVTVPWMPEHATFRAKLIPWRHYGRDEHFALQQERREGGSRATPLGSTVVLKNIKQAVTLLEDLDG